eukprot:4377960-Heterocapsa_arctica.AAC.1
MEKCRTDISYVEDPVAFDRTLDQQALPDSSRCRRKDVKVAATSGVQLLRHHASLDLVLGRLVGQYPSRRDGNCTVHRRFTFVNVIERAEVVEAV